MSNPELNPDAIHRNVLPAASISIDPGGNIEAKDLAAAILELDNEKVSANEVAALVPAQKIRFSTIFEDPSRVLLQDSATAGAAAAHSAFGINLNRGTTAGGWADMRSRDFTMAPVFNLDPEISVMPLAEMPGAGNSYDGYIVLGAVAPNPGAANPALKHIGIHFAYTNGVLAARGTVGNGTVQTEVALPVPGDLDNYLVWTARMVSGSRVDFLCNGTKYGEITTGLPTGGLTHWVYQANQKGVAGTAPALLRPAQMSWAWKG